MSSNFNFKNDLKSQQATVEFQIPKASQKVHNFLKKMWVQFQNDLKSQQATVEFQMLKACHKNTTFLTKIGFPFPEWP